MKIIKYLTLLVVFAPANVFAAGLINVNNGYAGVTVPQSTVIYGEFEEDLSYSCVGIGETSSTRFGFDDVVDPNGASLAGFIDATNMVPKISKGINFTDPVPDTMRRVSFIAPSSGIYSFSVGRDIATGDEVVNFQCKETTLYGGFNTFVNNFNFLEITNINNATVTGEITAVDFNGTVIVDKQPFSVEPGRRIDIDIHSAAGENKFGNIKVNYLGPVGSIKAFLSQYKGDATDFELKSSLELTRRDS